MRLRDILDSNLDNPAGLVRAILTHTHELNEAMAYLNEQIAKNPRFLHDLFSTQNEMGDNIFSAALRRGHSELFFVLVDLLMRKDNAELLNIVLTGDGVGKILMAEMPDGDSLFHRVSKSQHADMIDAFDNFLDNMAEQNPELALAVLEKRDKDGKTVAELEDMMAVAMEENKKIYMDVIHNAMRGPVSAEVIQRMVDVHHKDVNAYDDAGHTPMQIAISCANLSAVEALLVCDADVNQMVYDNYSAQGFSYLEYCVSVRNQGNAKVIDKIVEMLIKAGAEYPDYQQPFPVDLKMKIMAAFLRFGDEQQVRAAVNDVEPMIDLESLLNSAVAYASAAGDNVRMALLLSLQRRESVSAEKQTVDAVGKMIANPKKPFAETLLFAERVGINQANASGETLLHKAAISGRLDLLTEVLKKANPNVVTQDGMTPLHYFVHAQCFRGDDLFVDEKFQPDEPGYEKDRDDFDAEDTRFSRARQEGRATSQKGNDRMFNDVVEILGDEELASVAASASLVDEKLAKQIIMTLADQVDSQDKDGETPLMTAIKNDAHMLIPHLAEFSRQINLADNTGMTALHWAVQRNNQAAVQCLLKQGADKYQSNAEGHYPEFYASQASTRQLVETLVPPPLSL